MHLLQYASLCLMLEACTIANPDYELEEQLDASIPVRSSCAPGAFLGCVGFQLLRCGSTGKVLAEDCHPHLCNLHAQRCNRCDPRVPLSCEGGELVLCPATGDPQRFPCTHGCQAGRCRDCTPQAFYLDRDRDGHGDPSTSLEACQPPHGYVAVGDDCDDADPRVYPGQTGLFSEPTAAGSYDYNCDEIEEQESSSKVWCSGSGTACSGDGWAFSVPSCGSSGLLARCTPYLGLVCGPVTSLNVQRCR